MSAEGASILEASDSVSGQEDLSHFPSIGEDVYAGLRSAFKQIPSKYFYDARGSQLFEQITELPEYYPTRAEQALLNIHAREIAELTGAACVIEFGAGSSKKTLALLGELWGYGGLRTFCPMDISAEPLERARGLIGRDLPGLEVVPLIGDFDHALDSLPEMSPKLLLFLGGTIGNFVPGERVSFLRKIGELLGPRDHLLLGTDLVKDIGVLEAAYNDIDGVTAAFNLNVLNVINSHLDANFELDAFEHVAFFDSENSWIEMRLRSRHHQTVVVEAVDLELTLTEGEEIRTEISCKFTRSQLEQELKRAGLYLKEWFTDPEALFGASLIGPGQD